MKYVQGLKKEIFSGPGHGIVFLLLLAGYGSKPERVFSGAGPAVAVKGFNQAYSNVWQQRRLREGSGYLLPNPVRSAVV